MSIRSRLTIIFLVLVTAPLLIVGFLTFQSYEHSLKTARMAQLQDLARFKTDKIEAYFIQLKEGMNLARTFYNIRQNLPILSRVSQDTAAPAVTKARKTLDLQLKKTRKILGLADIMLADTDGTIVYVSNPDYSTNEISRPIVDIWPSSSPLNSDSFCISGIFLNNSEGNRPEMFATAPVQDLAGAAAGTIIFEIDMAPLYAIIQDTAGLGKSGEVLICRKTGTDIVYLNPLRHDSNAALKRQVKIGSPIALPAQNAILGKTGVGRSVDYRGKDVIAAWQPIPSQNWGLVAKIDSREAFDAVTKLNRLLLLILAAGITGAAIATFFVARSISLPIQVLSKGASIIGGGNLDYKVGIASNDEIGKLSRAFDKMTTNLKTTMASRDELNREIEERTNVQKDLTRSNKDLEQFAYVASHDLQEPLRAVAGFMGLLNRQYRKKLDGEGQEYIDLSIEGAERMQTLIHDLLTFSRVGPKGGAFGPMELGDAADNAAQALHAAITEFDAIVTHDQLPNINANLSQMTQLFQNLIGNAIKFRGTEQPRIHISAKHTETHWQISVRDNGIGIEPQYFDRIFLIFQRLHTRTEYDGTGIGLAICKKIVERHGGTLWVESALGSGAVFFFTIPDRGVNS